MTPKLNLKAFLLSFFFVLFLAALLWPSSGGLREKFRRSACAANMTKIGMAFAQYAADNQGALPPGDIHEAMQALRRLDYIGIELLRGLSLKNPRFGEPIPLTKEMLPFVYFGDGMNLRTAPKATPLLCDLPDRHKQFGHVLYADGHLESFKGEDWFAAHVAKPIESAKAEKAKAEQAAPPSKE